MNNFAKPSFFISVLMWTMAARVSIKTWTGPAPAWYFSIFHKDVNLFYTSRIPILKSRPNPCREILPLPPKLGKYREFIFCLIESSPLKGSKQWRHLFVKARSVSKTRREKANVKMLLSLSSMTRTLKGFYNLLLLFSLHLNDGLQLLPWRTSLRDYFKKMDERLCPIF